MDAAKAPAYPVGTVPGPPEVPLYVSIEWAAKLAGVSRERMDQWSKAAVDPIPHIAAGRAKKLIRAAAIPAYAAAHESC